MDPEIQPVLQQMRISRCYENEIPFECSACKTADAEFETAVWVDEQDPEKDEPYTEMVCGVCLAIQLLQESAEESVVLEKNGGAIGVSRGVPE